MNLALIALLLAASPAAEPEPSPVAPDAPAAAPSPSAPEVSDRIRSIQPRAIVKRGRFSLTAWGTASVNDPFQTKAGGTLSLAFHLENTLAFSLRGGILRVLKDEDLQVARQNFQVGIVASQPGWLAMADAEWTPVYGKLRFGDSILHLDGYVIGGLGTVVSRGPEVAFEAGVGLRFIATEWLAFNLAWLNTFYLDKPVGSSTTLIQNLMTANVGVSVFLPFSNRSTP
jgi:outer membrane beta-barrel protein